MSGGDQNEFFSAGGTNDDLKKLLLSARDEDKQALEKPRTDVETINFTERGGKGNELRLTKKSLQSTSSVSVSDSLTMPVRNQ